MLPLHRERESTIVLINDDQEQGSSSKFRVKDIAPDYYDDYKFGDEVEKDEEEDEGPSEQWASSVISYSSYWGGDPNSYHANNVVGPCRVYPTYSSSASAWCPNNTAGPEFIELGYDNIVAVYSVHIYESSTPGSVTKISGKRPNSNEWVVLWAGPSTNNIHVARDFCPDLTLKGFKTNAIRLDLDMNGGWTEIDAVKICGKGGTPKVEIPEISKFYRSLLRDALHTDLTVVHKSSGREIKCLKAILSARSPYLKSLIDSSVNNTIIIDTFAPFPALMAAMDYMYSSYSNVRPCHLIETFVLADQLMLPGLSTFCTELFHNVVSKDNVIVFYSAAKEHRSQNFLKSILDYMAINYKEVFLQQDLHIVEKSDLLSICRTIATKNHN